MILQYVRTKDELLSVDLMGAQEGKLPGDIPIPWLFTAKVGSTQFFQLV